jgi:hypothetical protein
VLIVISSELELQSQSNPVVELFASTFLPRLELVYIMLGATRGRDHGTCFDY